MENAPSIILFWYLGIAFFVVTIALVTVAILLLKRGKTQNKSKMRVLGKICLALGIICLFQFRRNEEDMYTPKLTENNE